MAHRFSRALPGAPCMGGSLLLGVLPRLLRDPLSLYAEATGMGEIVRLRLPLGPAYFISSPELIQDVIQKRARIFQRPPILRRILEGLGGDNLMTREGDAWLSRRRLMQPSLQRAALASLSELILDAIDSTLDAWEPGLDREACMREHMVALTQEVVARTLFGVSLLRFPLLGRACSTVTEYISYRATTPLSAPLWFPTARNRAVRSARRYVDALTDQLLANPRAEGSGRPDLLSRLRDARDPETGEGLDHEQLRREFQVLIGAGQSTTSEALSFCFSLLGSHPTVLTKLVQELGVAVGERRIALSDLDRLPLLQQVLRETLRLYPPSYVLARAPIEATNLGGVLLRPGTSVLFSPYTLHRDPRFWDSPASFRPERFAPGGESGRVPRYAYLPFGAGPRRCIGESLAQLEMLLAVGRILQRFELHLPCEPAPALSSGFALGLAQGLPVRLAARVAT